MTQITVEQFNCFPKKKFTFRKTHSSYSKNYYAIKDKFNPKIIFIQRNIFDMMYSRYHHILSDEKHWQHSVLKNLDIDRGFLKSCTHVNSIEKNYFNTHVPPLKILFGLVVKLGKKSSTKMI